MKTKKAEVIAFYLPQFYPVKENDVWWGKGFTEWTNVGKAKKYFPTHYQPRIPADLGYYDLRISEVREQQAEMAKEAGIAAFCYWHYWFGNGRQLLDMPLKEVVKSGKPDFPFCLGWANHDWSKKNWNKDVSRFSNEYLMKQEYPGKEDVDNHFYTMLPMFSDSRYYKTHGKLLFYIYAAELIPDLSYFIERWQELAEINKLPGFFFVAGCMDTEKLNSENFKLCDAVSVDLKSKAFGTGGIKWKRRLSYLFPFPINVVNYKKAIKKWESPIYKNARIYPTIYPNWDHSPRVGNSGTILHNSTPELFKNHVEYMIDMVKEKEMDDRIIFLKSWNEWAEGNYMEPDLKFGKRYINALREILHG